MYDCRFSAENNDDRNDKTNPRQEGLLICNFKSHRCWLHSANIKVASWQWGWIGPIMRSCYTNSQGLTSLAFSFSTRSATNRARWAAKTSPWNGVVSCLPRTWTEKGISSSTKHDQEPKIRKHNHIVLKINAIDPICNPLWKVQALTVRALWDDSWHKGSRHFPGAD